jgi:hypothetical protein
VYLNRAPTQVTLPLVQLSSDELAHAICIGTLFAVSAH